MSLRAIFNRCQPLCKLPLQVGNHRFLDDRLWHNGFGELRRIERSPSVNGLTRGGITAEFGYDVLGRLDSVDRWVTGSQTGMAGNAAVSTDLDYSDGGRLVGVTHTGIGDEVLVGYQLRYSLSSDGTLSQGIARDGASIPAQSSNHAHDAAGQLTGSTVWREGQLGSPTETTHYDEAGNPTRQTIDPNNLVVADADFTYQYDAEGRRQSRTAKDGSSHVVYAWDHRSRLISVTTYSGSAASGQPTRQVEYGYDALDRRVSKLVSEAGQPLLRERLINDGEHLIAVTDADNELTERILHGVQVDQVLAEERYGTGARQVLLPLSDHQGSVKEVAVWDDALNQITSVHSNEIDAWGVESPAAGSPTSRFGYTGRDRDPETDLNVLPSPVLRPGHPQVHQARPDRVQSRRREPGTLRRKCT